MIVFYYYYRRNSSTTKYWVDLLLLPSRNSCGLDLLYEDTQVAFVIRSQSNDAESEALSFRLVQLKEKGEKKAEVVLKNCKIKSKKREDGTKGGGWGTETDLLIQLKRREVERRTEKTECSSSNFKLSDSFHASRQKTKLCAPSRSNPADQCSSQQARFFTKPPKED